MLVQIFLIVITIIVLIVFGTVFYAVIMLVKTVIKKGKKEKQEREIIKTGDMIKSYMADKDMTNTDELLANINIPKNMDVLNDSGEIIIKFNNIKYNVNKERFLVSC